MNSCRSLQTGRFTSLLLLLLTITLASAQETSEATADEPRHWLWSTAHAIPDATTSEQSGYFALIEGLNERIYVGTAKYGDNAYLIEFDPDPETMRVVVDAEKEIGVDLKGFAAQAKIHSRNNVGRSGRIYFGTKQGYIKTGSNETLQDYPGGYPMVYDPKTETTKVYDIPIKHQGIISVTPDESRGLAYISTCSDERPVESSHFMVLNLDTGKYRDLIDTEHIYAFIVVDAQGRAYHPLRGGDIARYSPDTGELTRLRQTIDGKPPTEASFLATEHSHPINWEVSPDRKTLYALAMSGNQLFAYDLDVEGDVLAGRSLGPLVPNAKQTDCRAMCVGPDGTVWAGVMVTVEGRPQLPHLVSYTPGNDAPVDHGPIAIENPDYTSFEGEYKHGVHRPFNQELVSRYVIMGICAAKDGTIYLTTLYPFTLHAVKIPSVAGITTEYRHNAHADVILTRLLKTDTLDNQGQPTSVKLDSLYVDQFPENDLSRQFAAEHDVPMMETVRDSLLISEDEHGQKQLGVDGVFLVAEHGQYPRSETGQIIYPKRRLFGEIQQAFREAGESVPVFCDKHLADNWEDAKWIYDVSKELDFPMMAGSSLPTLWRFPPVDVRRDSHLDEVVALSYSSLDAYGFHAMEMVQCLIERRHGGETGVASVECLTGDDVWKAAREGRFDRTLLGEALSRLKVQPIPEGMTLEELSPDPVLFLVKHIDGLRVSVLTAGSAVKEWAVAWRYGENDETPNKVESTLFWTQEKRPFMHFTYLNQGIEKMMHTGKPTWPVERTLLTSGTLDALLRSKVTGKKLDTPWLNVEYSSDWDWRQPPIP